MAKIAKSNVFEKEKAMKVCPQCRNEFEEEYNFCLQDGTPLVDSISETIPENTQNKLAMEDESPVGDETLVLPDKPSNNYSLPSTEVPANEEETQEALKKTEASVIPKEQSAIPTEQWNEQNSAKNKHLFDIKLDSSTVDEPPIFQSELLSNYDENNNPNKRLAIGGIVVACLLLFVIVISGYRYLQSPDKSNEIALANKTTSKSESDVGGQNSNIELSNLNLALDSNNSNSRSIKQTDEETSKVKEKSESVTKDSSKSSDSKDSGNDKDRRKSSDLRDSGGFDSGGGSGNGSSSGDNNPPPPPSPKPVPPTVPKRISGGVVNGKATSLPKPAYPAAARAANITGSVNVAIVISKSGSVTSASAVSGHPLLKPAAVSAARRATFRPTILSGQAVEVSGIVVYNFQ